MKKKKNVTYLFVLLMMVIGIIGTGCTTRNSENESTNINTSYNNQVVETIREASSQKTTSLVDAIAVASESVVVVNASSTSFSSSGSGVIVGRSEDNQVYYVMTCHHVIDSTTTQEVILADGSKYNATLIGGDPLSDVAVLGIQENEKELTIAHFIDDSSTIHVGSTAIAIGNPLGTLGGTVTMGIISSASRSMTMSDGTILELIQTDAAINSGNSGGGLFNSEGILVGMVNAKYASEGVEGLGFAIPANRCYDIATELIKKGYVEGEVNLGLTISDGYVSSGFFYGPSEKVVYVSAVDANSSAASYLQKEDIIIGITYNKDEVLSNVSSASKVNEWIASLNLKIGDTLSFDIKRGSTSTETQTITITMVQYKYTA
jgi:serine protease Do